jgi:copper(I)-binding protein
MTILTRFAAPLVAASLMAGSVAACSQPERAASENRDQGASVVTVGDQWVKAAQTGMTGLFGTLKNSGTREVTVVSAASPVAGRVELHEVAGPPGSTTMRPKSGGLAIPAGGSHVLAPGGDHIMLMDLKTPLKVGSDVEVTLTFADGTTLPFSAQVRDYSGADEKYEPTEHAGGHG